MAAIHDGWKKTCKGKLQHERLVELADGKRTADQITDIINREYRDKKHVDSIRRKCERMGLPFARKTTSNSGSRWDIVKNGKSEEDTLNDLATGSKTLEQIQEALETEFGGLRPRRSINSVRKKVEKVRKGAYVHGERVIPPATTDEGTVRLQIEYDRRIERLTNELTKVRGLYREAVRKDTVVERIVEDIRTVIGALPPTSFPNIVHPYDAKKVKLTTEEVHLLLSDTHVGEVVAADEVLGLNEYNFEIFKSRLKHLENTVLDLCFSKMLGYRFPKLNVSMLGDFLTGTIHDELVETSDINIMDALVGSVWVFAQFFRNLLQTFESIEVRCVVGNHGRLHKKPRYKQPYINWDYLFYYMLDMLFAADERITFQIPRSFFLLDEIGKQTWLLLHGDNVQCFTPDTMITLPDFTTKRIADIVIGDEVISGDGDTQTVTNIFRFDNKKEITKIHLYGLPSDGIEVTPQHKVWALPMQNKDGEPEWMYAGHLSAGDYLVVPRPKIHENITDIPVAEMLSWIEPHPNDKPFPETITPSEDLGLILGHYLGDGSVTVGGSNRYHGGIEIAFNSEETVFIKDFQDAWERVFGYRMSEYTRADLKVRCTRVQTCHKYAGELLHLLGSKGAHDKTLHPMVFGWPIPTLKSLLIGYLRADGHTVRYKYRDKFNTHRVTATTVSKNLCTQLYWLSLLCGFAPSMKIRTWSGKPVYQLSFFGDDAREIGPTVQRNYTSDDDGSIRRKQTPRIINHKDYILVQIRDIKRVSYDGEVYDLEVSGSHTYTANFAKVHNSWNSIPFYGLNRMAARFQELMASQGRYIKYIALGHFHNMSALQTVAGRKIINGSFCGATEFSVKKMQGGSEPIQLLHGLHPEKGISWEFQINLQRADPALASAYQYTKEYDAARQFAQCLTE